ncbi:MAG TPA: EscU/YscU/HrcU family type III secretion system export apparatus switch protein [Ideonella sp.]|uniref:EscU/YscU/HrcU family type III secretion system export apparatus switch protein n=1 Tax=Ideonella sp. TaxID=1929293 RepID=UPI002E31AEA1|nr:EscU/YscU/HrcU family type III secretion system export apparatus switch protein [Ideonella sp.]HEX5687932.1 EscU/YscU/HrcU family type III secretion system export apparatus switch protein [Ideonella sp.]
MSDKKFKPTPRRLREARRKGDVPRSAELTSAAAFVGAMLGVVWSANALVPAVRSLWFRAVDPVAWAQGPEFLGPFVTQAILTLAQIALPALLLAAVGAAVGSFLQVGPLLAWQRIQPDLNRLNPVNGLQQIFAWRNAFGLAMLVLKALLLGGVIWASVRWSLDSAVRLGNAPPLKVLDVAGPLLSRVSAWAAVIFALVAAADLAFQRFDHLRQQRMSLEEVKREHRDDEGDPHVRNQRRSLRHEALFSALPDRMKFAHVVIHTPGVAIALMRLGKGQGAYVAAKGRGEIAAQIRALAEAQTLPQVQLNELTEQIDRTVPLDQTVPDPLAGSLARALGWEGSPGVVTKP